MLGSHLEDHSPLVNTMQALAPSKVTFKKGVRMTPSQYHKLVRLFLGKSIPEPLEKPDWLVFAAVLKDTSKFKYPWRLLRVRARLLAWVENNQLLFNEWLPDIHDVDPKFLELLLLTRPPPRHPYARRQRITRCPPQQPHPAGQAAAGAAESSSGRYTYPLGPGRLELPGLGTPRRFLGTDRPGARQSRKKTTPITPPPVPMEPKYYREPGPTNPLNPPGMEARSASLVCVQLPRQPNAPFPHRYLPHPQTWSPQSPAVQPSVPRRPRLAKSRIAIVKRMY